MLIVGLITRSPAQVVFGASAYLGLSLTMSAILRISRAPGMLGLLHPLGAVIMARIILRSIRRGTGRIEWKDRTYSHP